ncbi:hypothetical protein SAMN05660649_03734 [Desulfotomaculum arcticum]|uniref:Uncharacterized protein n=1 Tax=Desulfotruncus arcticus DSM 17038 TaxID=1121424 RepID=A0A1I2X2P1_9FIRM|nr:hypothetical protein [Desulfotruncus arcticus]SFH06966.1 hypothetical protein SAMN05660649_03734 [Desulfotomaculum arcticum] [Desulfotruncus arcticus DSM 17038]
MERSFNGDINRELAMSLNVQSSQFLEMVSTYAFLLESGYDDHSAITKAIELKPHLSGFAEEAKNFYHHTVVYQ